MKPRAAIDGSDLRSASTIFNELVAKSLQIDLGVHQPGRWSLTPPFGDVIAELRTKRFGTLTDARSVNEAEDINVFDRESGGGTFLSADLGGEARRARPFRIRQDEWLDYDIIAYDLDVQLSPDRVWIDGDGRMKSKIRSSATSSLTLKLAETVNIQGSGTCPISDGCCICASSDRTASSSICRRC